MSAQSLVTSRSAYDPAAVTMLRDALKIACAGSVDPNFRGRLAAIILDSAHAGFSSESLATMALARHASLLSSQTEEQLHFLS